MLNTRLRVKDVNSNFEDLQKLARKIGNLDNIHKKYNEKIDEMVKNIDENIHFLNLIASNLQ